MNVESKLQYGESLDVQGRSSLNLCHRTLRYIYLIGVFVSNQQSIATTLHCIQIMHNSNESNQTAGRLSEANHRALLRGKFGRVRILIMGKRNAGKTTILRKMTNSVDDNPIVHDEQGNQVRFLWL